MGKVIEKSKLESGGKPKWTQWSPLGALTKSEKKKTVDDSALEVHFYDYSHHVNFKTEFFLERR